jgi:ABC-type uncharacterized transport system permease subunit
MENGWRRFTGGDALSFIEHQLLSSLINLLIGFFLALYMVLRWKYLMLRSTFLSQVMRDLWRYIISSGYKIHYNSRLAFIILTTSSPLDTKFPLTHVYPP